MICYNYTSVSCYVIIYTGNGCSGIQGGRCVWRELCTLFGDYATSTQHHSSQRPWTPTPLLCLLREPIPDSFACSCQASSQQTSSLQTMSSRSILVAALFTGVLPLHTRTRYWVGQRASKLAWQAHDRSQLDVTSDVNADVTASGLSRQDCQSTVWPRLHFSIYTRVIPLIRGLLEQNSHDFY